MTKTVKLGCSDSDSDLDRIAQAVRKARKTVVVTGAGISCNAGIPDFRSSDGLYNMVKHMYPKAVVKGKDLFDAVLFSNPTSIRVFFTFMAQLRRSILQARSTSTHRLIKHLKDKGRLLRCYTQNIDGLEKEVGLETGIHANWRNLDVVQLHGDIHSLKCIMCEEQYSWTKDTEEQLSDGDAPACPACSDVLAEREQKGKRCIGVGSLRPNIVLYGEEHPNGDLIGKCASRDLRSKPDMLIIVGTSLKVAGIRKLVKDMARAVREKDGLVVFVNATGVSSSTWNDIIDYHVEADCDAWVDDLRARIPNFFLAQSTIPDYAVTKQPQKAKKKRSGTAEGQAKAKKARSTKISIESVLADSDDVPSDCPPLSQSSTMSDPESYSSDDRVHQWTNAGPVPHAVLNAQWQYHEDISPSHYYVKQEFIGYETQPVKLPPISHLLATIPGVPTYNSGYPRTLF